MRQMVGCRGGVRFTKHGKQHMRGVETENPGRGRAEQEGLRPEKKEGLIGILSSVGTGSR